MLRFVIYAIVATILTVIVILLLPYMLPNRKFKNYSDKQLREAALSKGLRSIPKSYESLLKIKDNSKFLTSKNIALGKELFFDTNLSYHKNVSCATCHLISKNQTKASKPIIALASSKDDNKTNCVLCHLRDESGVDRLQTSLGDNGVKNPLHLNTMTILNSSLAKYLTWSAKYKSLSEVIEESITSHFKMNLKADILKQRLKNNKKYVKGDIRDLEDVKIAISAYVRTLLTRGSFDRFLDGDDNAISQEAKRGLANFINFGCKGCHTGMSVGGQVIERFPLKDFVTIKTLGYDAPLLSTGNFFPFENRGGFLGKENKHLFRVPILRNVTKTSPYFHNGSVPKIEEAVAIMGKYQLGLKLTDTQIDEIVAFLKTLEGDIVEYKK